MTDIIDHITPEMSIKEIHGVVLGEIMTQSESDVAEAVRLCAIPHWFDEEILAWLRGEGREPSERTGEILAELTEMPFVSPYGDRDGHPDAPPGVHCRTGRGILSDSAELSPDHWRPTNSEDNTYQSCLPALSPNHRLSRARGR